MKKIKSILQSLKGFITDLWMLPLAVILMSWHNKISVTLGLFPPMNPEKIGKIVSAFVLFLLVMFLIRLYTMGQYFKEYDKGLIKKDNKIWSNELSYWQQFISLRVERWVLMVVFAIILTAL